jgi:hypothetical protein
MLSVIELRRHYNLVTLDTSGESLRVKMVMTRLMRSGSVHCAVLPDLDGEATSQ